MNNISDDELIMLYYEQNEDALDLLHERYSKVINILLKKHNIAISNKGISKVELYNECLVAFYDALDTYNPRVASFSTLANIVINRKIIKILKKPYYDSTKNNSSLVSSDDFEYIDLNKKYQDPLLTLIESEEKKDLDEKITELLSPLEKVIYDYKKQGYNIDQISLITKIEYKQIDNALQRIRRKIRLYFKEYLCA